MTTSSYRRGILVAVAALCTACGDPLKPIATFPNLLDAATVHAFNAPQSIVASALNLYDGATVRPDSRFDFDLVFDIDDQGRALVIPVREFAGIAGGHPVGLQIVPQSNFDLVREAPRGGYVFDSTFAVSAGTILAVESAKPGICSVYSLGATFFSKVMVTDVDLQNRRIGIAFVVNRNCGFRGLGPGIPSS